MEYSTYNASTSPLEERETSQASIVNIAAIGDLHCPYTNPGYLKSVFKEIGAQADVVLLCGDLTHYGEPSETMILLECLQSLQCPVICVLGNHDFEGRKADTVTQLLQEAGVTIWTATRIPSVELISSEPRALPEDLGNMPCKPGENLL